MRRNLVATGLVLALWPMGLMLLSLVMPSLRGFFASGTVIIAYASIGAGLALIFLGFRKPRTQRMQ